MREAWGPIQAALRPVVAALVGLALGVGVTALAGENPWSVLLVLWNGAFGSAYSTGLTIFYATPLMLTGLAVALPFKTGLFNIGAEGQLTMGALGATLAGLACAGVPSLLAVPLVGLAAFAAGGAWGFIPGWLKAYRGSHEVITTIMLNFIAAGLASWAVLNVVRSTSSQNPESERLAESLLLSPFTLFEGAPVTPAVFLALAAAVMVWFLLARTTAGFRARAVGAAVEVAETAGIDARRTQVMAMVIGGGMAGLVGVVEVLGNAGRLRLGFSPDYGFIGIPVALLARSHPIGLIFSALLFGALHKGASELDLETLYVTRDLSNVIQAFVILAVSAEGVFTFWRRRAPA